MVIVQLNGGLGNQLFQFAAAKSLSLYHNVLLKIDISSFQRQNLPDLEVPRDFELYNFNGIKDKIFALSEKENADIIRFLKKKSFAKLLPNHKRKIYSEPFFHFDANFFNSRKDVLLRGQWQSEKYFLPYSTFLKEALQLKPGLIKNSLLRGSEVSSTNSVSVHVRRADYLRKPVILEWHGVMSKEYYANAFKVLDEKIGSYDVYYFTDDPQWTKSALLPLRKGEIISESTSSHYEDLYLMSQCRHNIIANSSFSWWGAWLNNNPDKIVIGPKQWFNKGPKDTYDILPETWVKI